MLLKVFLEMCERRLGVESAVGRAFSGLCRALALIKAFDKQVQELLDLPEAIRNRCVPGDSRPTIADT